MDSRSIESATLCGTASARAHAFPPARAHRIVLRAGDGSGECLGSYDLLALFQLLRRVLIARLYLGHALVVAQLSRARVSLQGMGADGRRPATRRILVLAQQEQRSRPPVVALQQRARVRRLDARPCGAKLERKAGREPPPASPSAPSHTAGPAPRCAARPPAQRRSSPARSWRLRGWRAAPPVPSRTSSPQPPARTCTAARRARSASLRTRVSRRRRARTARRRASVQRVRLRLEPLHLALLPRLILVHGVVRRGTEVGGRN